MERQRQNEKLSPASVSHPYRARNSLLIPSPLYTIHTRETYWEKEPPTLGVGINVYLAHTQQGVEHGCRSTVITGENLRRLSDPKPPTKIHNVTPMSHQSSRASSSFRPKTTYKDP
eukprot:1374302-Amorphochlora_amoeboformis.AAC.2